MISARGLHSAASRSTLNFGRWHAGLVTAITKDFGSLFEQLRAIMARHSDGMDLVHDLPDHYYLNTKHVRRDGYVLMFGAVQIRARYVSYHLMPLYQATDRGQLAASPLRSGRRSSERRPRPRAEPAIQPGRRGRR